MWANTTHPERCPIKFYKQYSDLRPITYCNENDPFYIATNTNRQLSAKWYKSQPIGVNKLSKFVQLMAKNAGLTNKNNENHASNDTSRPSRKLTNHSARKFMIQKLNDNRVPPSHIMQISGHKNVESINSYSKLNLSQQRTISHVLNETVDVQSTTVCRQSSGSTELNVATTGTRSTTNNDILEPASASCDLGLAINNEKLPTHLAGKFSSLFAGPIHGGSFVININNTYKTESRKRRRVIYDTDSSENSQ